MSTLGGVDCQGEESGIEKVHLVPPHELLFSIRIFNIYGSIQDVPKK